MRIITCLVIVLLLGSEMVRARQFQVDTAEVKADRPSYLLLDKGLQFRITEAINSMYNFDFETAERGFAVMRYNYPEHPLPYFLMGLAQWWKIVPDMENDQNDELFMRFMEETIDKAEVMLEDEPENKEAAFFLAAAYGFKGRLLSERDSWTATAIAGKNALKYMELSKGDEELSPELLLGDALFNYFSVWIPENYPLMKPVMALFPKGDKALGLMQLEEVAKNAFYARVEAQYFLFRLYASEEKRPYDALQITEYLHDKYPDNPYFHRFYARQLYAVGRGAQAKEQSLEILQRIEAGQEGYESNSGRYASFFTAQYYDRINDVPHAKEYYLKTVAFGEESESQESGYYLYSLLHLGKIAASEGEDKEAKAYLKKVKKYAKRKHPAHQEARDFLKKNKL
ncbi:tol-pal system protein YbgF [Echinicola strongylocentroti]|uniref:Tol-pal system protein YbgF n=1 Tax=Echinicola strongylocentroti TaxID=1795355 RepID=A0A2Z4IKY8_9BACT|nr:tol-pal system protein YbgF [Echinicola strongylocentroti]AWW31615.1 tol-pal system protein YbgF [Echinicola strongylocentroti]